MPQISEDIIQAMMKMTGLSRKETVKKLTQSLHEMNNGHVFKNQSLYEETNESTHSQYTESKYPYFLSRKKVLKYSIRITLKNIDPAIWRKFECPSNISLRHLSEIILQLMGWQNEHLNSIQAGRDTFFEPCYQRDSDMEGYGVTQHLNQEEFALSDILTEKGKTLTLEYDFGDSWRHEIRLSSINEYAPEETHEIIFLGGKRACPPEDCGGTSGYSNLLELLEQRKAGKRIDSEDKEMLDWYDMGKNYDPEYLDNESCKAICQKFGEMRKNNADEENSVGITRSGLFDEVVQLGFDIRETEPWMDLDDSDIFAVKMHDGSIVYVAVLGNSGELFEIQLYYGEESFGNYIQCSNMTIDNMMHTFDILDFGHWVNYLSIRYAEFEDYQMNSQTQRSLEEIADENGYGVMNYHGYPIPQQYAPHLVSTIVTDELTLLRMKEALEAISWFSEQIMEVEDLKLLGFNDQQVYPDEKGGKEVPLLVRVGVEYTVERTTLPALVTNYETPVLPENELTPLRKLQKSGSYYCRLIHLPEYVNAEDGHPAYAPLILIVVDKNTECLDSTEMQELSDTPLEDVMRQFIEIIRQKDHLPLRLATDDARTEALLSDFCRQLGITLELKRTKIKVLTKLCENLYRRF